MFQWHRHRDTQQGKTAILQAAGPPELLRALVVPGDVAPEDSPRLLSTTTMRSATETIGRTSVALTILALCLLLVLAVVF